MAEKTEQELVAAIRKAQAERDGDGSEFMGVTDLQQYIESGQVWHLEGAMGREAMRALDCGACFLPDEVHTDFWGNRVPARSMLKPGSKGTLENAARFYGV